MTQTDDKNSDLAMMVRRLYARVPDESVDEEESSRSGTRPKGYRRAS